MEEDRRQEFRRSSDQTVHGIKEDIGELKGRVRSVEKSIQGIDDSLRVLIKENAIVAEIHRMAIQHDKRLTVVENRCHERKAVLDAAEDHIEKDTPVHAVMGNFALKGWYVVIGILGMYLLERLPKIIELLK